MNLLSPSFILRLLIAFCSSAGVLALAQNVNPTGYAGRFNALSMTGGSYDPYTANATRSIPDLNVTGAVGDYPLVWVRTMNSRSAGGAGDLGVGGGWTHSYHWGASSDIFNTQTPGPQPITPSFCRMVARKVLL